MVASVVVGCYMQDSRMACFGTDMLQRANEFGEACIAAQTETVTSVLNQRHVENKSGRVAVVEMLIVYC